MRRPGGSLCSRWQMRSRRDRPKPQTGSSRDYKTHGIMREAYMHEIELPKMDEKHLAHVVGEQRDSEVVKAMLNLGTQGH